MEFVSAGTFRSLVVGLPRPVDAAFGGRRSLLLMAGFAQLVVV